MYQAKVQERHTFRKAQTAPNLWQNTLPAAMKFLTATCESKEGINDKIFACCLSALRNAICCFSSTKWVQSCTFRLSYTLLYLSSCSFPTFHKCERVRNELFLQILLKTKRHAVEVSCATAEHGNTLTCGAQLHLVSELTIPSRSSLLVLADMIRHDLNLSSACCCLSPPPHVSLCNALCTHCRGLCVALFAPCLWC